MPAIDIGDALPDLSVEIRDINGVLANAGAVTLTLTLPDLTTAAPTVSNPSTGVYTATYVAVQAGWHHARWVATGANQSAEEKWYSVGDAVDLEEVKDALRVSSTDSDDLLVSLISVATNVVEKASGRSLRRRTVTEYRTGGRYAVALSELPVESVTTVVENSVTLAAADYTLNPQTGVLYRGSGVTGATWYEGPIAVQVTYVAGTKLLEPKLRQAVIEQVRHMLEHHRGASGAPRAGGDSEWDPRDAFAIPTRVRELIGAAAPRF